MAAPPSDEPADAKGSTDPRIGKVLADRYRLHALVGEGGMGKVYSAEHVHMRKKLAVKVLHRELTSVPEVVARFEREAMAAANIDHPNVAAATDFGKLADGAVFLVLEYVQGKNLRDEIASGPFEVPRALHVARQIALALSAAHAQSIVHRDLKPENVMLIEKGGDSDFVKVLDFGIAKVPIGELSHATDKSKGHVITKAGMVFGTPEYMAPEQALGQAVDGRADLYALGVILFEMITGSRPFSGGEKVSILGLQLSKPPPKLRESLPGADIPEAVERVLEKLLAKEVALRFQKADEVAAAIEVMIGPPRPALASSPGSSAGAPKPPPPHVGKPTFLPNDPLPRFTDPEVDAALAVPAPKPPPKPAPMAPHVGKPTFLPNDPLPRFPSAHGLPNVEDLGVLQPVEGPKPVEPVQPDLEQAEKTRLAIKSDGAKVASAQKIDLAGMRSRARELVRTVQARSIVLLAKAKARSIVLIGQASTAVDKSRDRWPKPLRSKLSRVSGQTIVVAGLSLVGVLLLVVVLSLALRGSSSKSGTVGSATASASAAPVPEAPIGKDPSTQALEQAKAGGVPALEALAQKYSESAKVQLELADALANGKQYLKAAGAMGRALSLDPASKEDARAARALFQAAQVKDSQDAAFALLEGPMDGRGADILYDLAVEKGVKPNAQSRAERWIRSPELQKVASPSLAVAVAVRKSKSCPEVRSHLSRVKEVGDGRSMLYLEFFQRKSTQYACLNEGGELEQTMAAVRQRTGADGG